MPNLFFAVKSRCEFSLSFGTSRVIPNMTNAVLLISGRKLQDGLPLFTQ